jgi:multiple sugar transport system substrate-binding protein
MIAIGTRAANKGTATDFIMFMSSEQAAKSDTLATGPAHVNRALYSDPEILKKFPHFPILLKSIETANPSPKVVKYGDATLTMQRRRVRCPARSAHSRARGRGLQSKLESLTQ